MLTFTSIAVANAILLRPSPGFATNTSEHILIGFGGFSGWNAAIIAVLVALAFMATLQWYQRRTAEESLLASEERLTLVASSAQLGLWSSDCKLAVIAMTERCCAILGIANQPSISLEAFVATVHPEDRWGTRATMESLCSSGEAQTIEFRKIMPDGSLRWFLFTGHVRQQQPRRPRLLAGFFADITDRKRAQELSEAQHNELAHLLRVSALGRLSGAIAHELNQPLTAILSNAQAVRRMLSVEKPNLPEALDALDDIVSEDNRAGEVIHRLHDLLRKGTTRHEAIDLNELVGSTLRIVRSELIGRHVQVRNELAAGLALVSGDSVQLQQVLLNLVLNAMDAMAAVAPADRIIYIATRATVGGLVEIVVTDRGRGIAPAEAARLFHPFFTTKPDGLGLGLSICSTIIRSHGGELSLASNSDRGATATVVLPALG